MRNNINKYIKNINRDIFFAFFKNNWYLIFLFTFALIVRTIYSNYTVAISVDQVNYFTWAKELFKNHGYIWHGAIMRGRFCNGQQIDPFLGPFFIYLLALPALIGHWNFYFNSAFSGLLGAMSVVLLYYLVKLITSNKTAGYIAATLLAFSTTFIVSSRTIWNPFFLSFFVLVMLISFVKLIQGRERYLLIFILFLSLITQIHASAFLFVPAFILLWFVFKIKIKQKILWLYAALLAILSYLPMIYHEIKYHFENSREIFQIIFKPAECLSHSIKAGYFQTIDQTFRQFFNSLMISLTGRVYESSWGLWQDRGLEGLFLRFLAILIIILVLLIIVENFRKKKSLSDYHQLYGNFIKKYYPEFKESWQIFQELGEKAIKPDSVILNIGAGRSSRLETFFDLAKKVYGLDPNEKALSENRYISNRIVGRAESIPLTDSSVDIVILEWVMEHIENPERAFKEISRVLKPNGKIIFCTPNTKSPLMFLISLLKKISNPFSQIVIRQTLLDREKEEINPAYYRVNTRKKINKIFSQSGLRIIDLRTTGAPSYFRFSKPLLWAALQLEKISARPSFKWTRVYLLGVAQKDYYESSK